jgi:hypothetical protein
MRFISTRVHGSLDYLIGIVVALSPWLFGFAGTPTAWLHLVAGLAVIGVALMTDFELGLVRAIPMPAHLMLDGVIGVFLLISPLLFDLGAYATLHVAAGAAELALATMTSRTPVARALA